MDIFKLVGSVFVDTEEANKSLAKTDTQAETTGGKLKGIGEAAGKAALAIGTAAVGAGTALYGMANNAAAAADEVDKGSIRMGVSTEYFQQLRYTAGQCGVEMSTMEAAAKKLEGTDLNMEEAMANIMALTTEEERSAAAAELFGDGLAYKLSPILSGTGEDFNALMGRANELGLVMSEDSVAAGVVLGDTMSDVQQSFQAVVAEVGVQVLPIIQQLLDWVLTHMPEIKEFISTAMTVASEVFTKVGEIIGWLTEKFDEYWPIISAAVQTAVAAISEYWETTLKPTIEAVWTWVSDVWENKLKPTIEAVWEWVQKTAATLSEIWQSQIQPALQKVWEWVKNTWENFLRPTIELIWTWVQKTAQTLSDIWNNTIKPILERAWGFIQTLWNNSLKPIFTGITTFFKGVFSGDIKTAMSGLKTYIQGIWNGIVTVIKQPVNQIIGIINGFIRGITGGVNGVIRVLNRLQISVPQWVTDLTGVKSFGFNLAELSAPQIPYLAKGGDVTEEGAAIVGERGAELLQLPKGARVTPLDKAGDTTVNINIDVHPSEGMNEKELAEAVANRINDEVTRRRLAWA